jgi:eukaryotic-like serine/threonine-protein kinase
MSDAPVSPGDILAGKYRVDRVLGVGGMGVVVQATHMQLEQRVALKFMLPAAMASAEVAGRFLREARLAVKLRSEHVAKVMDVGTLESGSPYIVMEYLEGTDLDQLLKKHGPLPFADAAEYVIQACDAIAEAHALGIVHRDLKPANLFLARRADGAPLIKVLDFGISKASPLSEGAGAMTKTGTLMGSPYYMSPEQMRSAKNVDARSDVWSMGVVLYQILTARLPFDADTLGDIMVQVLTDDPVAISTLRPDTPHALQALVSRCLQRDRNARAQSVGEIAAALAPHAPARATSIAERIVSLVGGEPRPPAPEVRAGGVSSGLGITAPPAVSTTPPHAGKSGAGIVVGAVVALGLALGGGAYVWSRGSHRVPAAAVASAEVPATAPEATATVTAMAAPQVTVAAGAAPEPSVSGPAEVASAAPRAPVATPPAGGRRPPAPIPHAAAPIGPKKSVLDGRN